MAEVKFTDLALKDLEEIATYINHVPFVSHHFKFKEYFIIQIF